MTRLQIILSISLVVLLALLLTGVGSRNAATATAARRALLPEAESGKPTKVEIADGKGGEVVMTRSGNRWLLSEIGDYPVDALKVDELMRKLADLEVRRPAVSLARYHEAMRVAPDAFERRIRFWPAEGGDPVELYFGTTPNFRITHARRSDADEVYAVTDLASYEYAALPEQWVVDMHPEDFFDEASWLKLENAHGTVVCDKVGGAIWSNGDGLGPIDHEKVGQFLRSANGLWVRKPLGPVAPEHGFDEPVAKLTMKIGDPPDVDGEGHRGADTRREIVVLIGSQLEGDEPLYTMTREGFGFAASVRESSARRLIDDDRSAFAPDPPIDSTVPTEPPTGEMPVIEPPVAEQNGDEQAADGN